jgi:glyoxylase-like metal-dependent hydrolase (beta-lactamase superfamily II)
MARLEDRLPENVAGDFYVDRSCIDCDTCRRLAPAVFARSAESEQSYVHRQPANADDQWAAEKALVACPTSSIGAAGRIRAAAADAFPEPIAPDVGDIFYCGYAAASSFGAASYLIRRPSGNVLVDSPRASGRLLARLRGLGGATTIFLTHRDDVADHRWYREALGADRILHRADLSADTASIERPLEGPEPIPLADDLLVIPVPGHTRGSAALLYRDTFLFTGDHLWWSPRLGRLHASRGVAWYSFPEQVRSIERLLAHRFTWILPGHGRPYRSSSADAMREEIEKLLAALAA